MSTMIWKSQLKLDEASMLIAVFHESIELTFLWNEIMILLSQAEFYEKGGKLYKNMFCEKCDEKSSSWMDTFIE